MAQISFDATNVPVAKPRTVMPGGDYLGRIVESDLQATKDGNGTMLVLEIELMEPAEFRGRKVFDRLNVQNPNQTAQRIAQETLSAICHAVGKPRVLDSQELHGYPLCITLGVEKQEDRDPQNRVRGYQPQNVYKGPATVALSGGAPAGFGAGVVAGNVPFGAATQFGPATAGAAGFPQQQPQGFPQVQPQAGQPFGQAAAQQQPGPALTHGYPTATQVAGGQMPQNGQGGALPPGWGQPSPTATQAPQAAVQGAPWAPAAAPQGWAPQPAAQPQPQQTQGQPGWQPQRQ